MVSSDRMAEFRGVRWMQRSRGRWHPAALAVGLVALLGAWAATAAAAQATEDDGRAYTVDQLYLDFAEDLPVHPPTKLMMKLSVELGVVEDGYVSPRAGLETVRPQLMDVPKLEKDRMYESAINQIGASIVAHFKEWGYAGVVVTPHPEDIDPRTGRDLRLEGQTALRLIVKSMTGRGRPLKVGAVWETPDARDGRTYEISQFLVETAKPVEAQVNLKRLLRTPIVLAESPAGCDLANPSRPRPHRRQHDIPTWPKIFERSRPIVRLVPPSGAGPGRMHDGSIHDAKERDDQWRKV